MEFAMARVYGRNTQPEKKKKMMIEDNEGDMASANDLEGAESDGG